MNIERQKNVHLDDVPNIMSQINLVISLTSSSVEAPNTYILYILFHNFHVQRVAWFL